MKPSKPPGWTLPPGTREKRKTKSAVPAASALEQKQRLELEGREFERRRKVLRKLNDPENYPTQTELGEVMCVNRNTITRWEGGKLEIPTWGWKLLSYVEKENKERLSELHQKVS